jgi:predicted transcriptional regulator
MEKLTLTLQTLLIISYLEENPTSKMNNVSQKIGLSPQLVSYHREKHVEGRQTHHRVYILAEYETRRYADTFLWTSRQMDQTELSHISIK